MPPQVGLLHGVLRISHRPEHAVGQAEQAPTVRLKCRSWIRHAVHGTHAGLIVHQAMRRARESASPPVTRAITPSTNAAAAPTTPLPVPGPPVAIAKLSPPLTSAMSPPDSATMAPSRPDAMPTRLAGRTRASPPMATLTSATRATTVAQSRLGVRP